MDRLRIIGADWRRGGTVGLERFTLDAGERAERLPRLRRALGARELVYLATCNRVELIFSLPAAATGAVSGRHLRRLAFRDLVGREPEAGEAEHSLRLWGGEGALEHLLLVACGLDSAQLGEREIRGQLKESHRLATAWGLCGPRLDWAISRAMRVAREVERHTALADGRHSLAGIGIERLREHLDSRPGRVVLIGVSPMTERCGAALAAAGVELLVVNRGRSRGESLARRLGVPWRQLDEFRAEPEACAAIVTAVGARQPILDAADLARLVAAAEDPPLVVDFGVPANVEPKAAIRLGVPRIDMEAISSAAEANQSRRRDEVATAREFVDRALQELGRETAERATSPVLAEITRRYRQTALDGVERLFRRDLRHLGAAEREAVEAFALGLSKKLAHVPILGLRALASEHGFAAADTFLAASDAELAELLRGEDAEAEEAPPAAGRSGAGEAA